MTRLPIAAVLVLAAARPAAADPPGWVPPRTVTLSPADPTLGAVLAEVGKQTGMPVAVGDLDPATPCAVRFNKTPFWNALEEVAAKVGGRVVLGKGGREVSLAKRAGPAAAWSVDGPFRVAVRQVQSRIDFETGRSFTEVALEVAWEPRLPVFRLDATPAVSAAADDRGSPLTAGTARSRVAPSGRAFTTTVRIEGVPRAATKLTRLAGSLTVTAAPTMLQFEFPDLTQPQPVSAAAQDGVSATLRPVQKTDGKWEVTVEVGYPPGRPEFESFEGGAWVAENRLQLIDPAGAPHEPADWGFPEQGQRLVAEHWFPDGPKGASLGDRKGWKAVYRTPAPLVEFPVRFELKDIPLP